MISTIVQDWMYGHGKGFSEFESKVKAELQSYINKQGSEGNRCFFYIVYLVTALISRGSLVKDVLFMEKKREASAWIRFQSSIVEQLRNGSKNNKVQFHKLSFWNYSPDLDLSGSNCLSLSSHSVG